jgi:hypothetical protein
MSWYISYCMRSQKANGVVVVTEVLHLNKALALSNTDRIALVHCTGRISQR